VACRVWLNPLEEQSAQFRAPRGGLIDVGDNNGHRLGMQRNLAIASTALLSAGLALGTLLAIGGEEPGTFLVWVCAIGLAARLLLVLVSLMRRRLVREALSRQQPQHDRPINGAHRVLDPTTLELAPNARLIVLIVAFAIFDIAAFVLGFILRDEYQAIAVTTGVVILAIVIFLSITFARRLAP